ncbi:unnamed protein product [Ixodes persulcatus]
MQPASLATHVVVLVLSLTSSLCIDDQSASMGTTTAKPQSLMDSLREVLAKAMDNPSSSITRKVIEADISGECSLGLFKMMRGIRRLDPWAVRILDATAKLPTGFLQGTSADIGAYDECIGTVVNDEYGNKKVRGQYCVLQIKVGDDKTIVQEMLPAASLAHPRVINFTSYWTDPLIPGLRFGICTTDDCSAKDLQSLAEKLLEGKAKITIRDCVTNDKPVMDRTQRIIIGVLGCIGILIVISSLFDIYVSWKNPMLVKNAKLLQLLTAFSLPKNTKYVARVENDKSESSAMFTFMHGIRAISIIWIVLGHCYGGFTDNLSGRLNMLYYFERPELIVVTTGFQSVDTFLLISGFLLTYVVLKQKRNRLVVILIAVVRRYIRQRWTIVPLFFLLMCMHVLPLFATGPTSTEYYRKFYTEMSRHWWDLLLQIHNFRIKVESVALIHIWYVSADFQLFLVSIIVIQIFKKSKLWCGIIFVLMSLVCCGISAWIVHDTEIPPFMIGMTENFSTPKDTMENYYTLPFYHAVCFFVGCITWLLVDTYRHHRMSTIAQAILWAFSLSCGMGSVFMKCEWYLYKMPTTELGKMFLAFFDRIMWSIFVAWITFACSTKRGGVLNSVLSWNGFAPLSKLAFGVYFVHMPFYDLMNHIARERTYFSHFSLVSQCFSVLLWSYILSYFMYIACEAPVAHLDRIMFAPNRRKQDDDCGKAQESFHVKDNGVINCIYKEYCIEGNGKYRTRECD